MFRLGVIEESLESRDMLEILKPYFVSQKIEEVPGDEFPVWHTNEYHVPSEEIIYALENSIKKTWYAHAFNDEKLIVVLHGKSFDVSPNRDETWDEMIAYGKSVDVEERYIGSVPLSI